MFRNNGLLHHNVIIAASYKTCCIFLAFNRVGSAYWTGEIPMQSHVCFSVFFSNPRKRPDAKVLRVDHTDQLGSIHIQQVNSCIATVYHATILILMQDTDGVQKQWKQQIFTMKWQILALNPCLWVILRQITKPCHQ